MVRSISLRARRGLRGLVGFRARLALPLAAVLVAVCVVPEAHATGVTVTVSTTASTIDGTTTSVAALIASPGTDGKISFREAVAAVNATGPGNIIKFNVPNGSRVLADNFTTYLTAGSTTIDGDMDGDGDPDISIENTSLFVPLVITSDGNKLRNIAMPKGPALDSASNNLLSGLYLGTDVSGRVAQRLDANGVQISGGAGNMVENSVIAGLGPGNAGVGIEISNGSKANTISGNRIGVNIDGVATQND